MGIYRQLYHSHSMDRDIYNLYYRNGEIAVDYTTQWCERILTIREPVGYATELIYTQYRDKPQRYQLCYT